MVDLNEVEGRKFCVVFVQQVKDEEGKDKVRLQCLRGRASVEGGKLKVVDENRQVFTVPSTALPTLSPNDGTRMLGDAEYFAMVKVDENIDLQSSGEISEP